MSAGAVVVATSGMGTGSGRETTGFTGSGLGSSVGLGSALGCSLINVTIIADALVMASRAGESVSR